MTEDLPKNIKCYCCKSNASSFKFDFKGELVDKVYRCDRCLHIFTGCPDDFNVENFYAEEYRKDPDHYFYERAEREEYYKRILSFLKEVDPDFKPSSILEVGAGDGYFLEIAIKNFNLKPNSVTACELDKDLINILKDKGFNSNLGDLCSFNFNKKFDLFLALDVIEHIEDVSIIPNVIKNLVNKEGLALVQVPVARHVKPFRGHFHYFNVNSFFELFSESYLDGEGLDIINVFVNAPKITSRGASLLAVLRNNS